MSSDEPLFLDIDDVIEIHETQLEVYGGAPGLRDRGLLESAVAQPQTSFGGELVHRPSEALYELTMGVAEGRIQKATVAVELERIAKSER